MLAHRQIQGFGQARWLLPLALLGVGLIALSTRWGAGTSPDSTAYVSIARNLLSGQGYQDLYGSNAAIWPPFYPLLLAFVGLFGPDPLVAARWINVALFGTNILLVGLVLRRYARSPWIPILGSFLVLTCVDLLEIHSMAWTEPLFIFLGLLGLLFIAEYAERQSRSLLLASAAVIALATFTRYAGLSLVATGVAVVLFFTRQRAIKKLTDSLLFGVTACLPLVGWIIRNVLVSGSTTARTLLFHPITSHQVERSFKTISLWILPGWVPFNVRTIAMIAAVGGMLLVTLFIAPKPHKPQAAEAGPALPELPLVMGVFLAMYIALLVISVTFLDKYTVLSLRGMAPAFPPALILTLCLGDRLLWRMERVIKLKIACAVLCVLFAVWYANRALWWVRWKHQDGLGFASSRWRESELIERVRELDPEVPFFTNAVDVIYLGTNRTGLQIPAKRKTARWGYGPNERFTAELATMRERLEREGGVIVFFDTIRGRGYLASRHDLEEAMPLRVRTRASDGVILGIKPSQPERER